MSDVWDFYFARVDGTPASIKGVPPSDVEEALNYLARIAASDAEAQDSILDLTEKRWERLQRDERRWAQRYRKSRTHLIYPPATAGPQQRVDPRNDKVVPF